MINEKHVILNCIKKDLRKNEKQQVPELEDREDDHNTAALSLFSENEFQLIIAKESKFMVCNFKRK